MGKQMNVPKLRFSEFEGEWVEKKLGDVADYTKGYAFQSIHYQCEGIRIIRVSDLGAREIKSDGEKIFIDKKIATELIKYKLFKDEIIITTVGSKPELIDSSVGRGVFVNKENEGLLNQNMLKINKSEKVVNKFLAGYINTNHYFEYIKLIQRGNANQSNITVADLLKYEISFPSLSEQTKIASFLTAADDKLTQLKKKKSLLEEYKKGVMQKIFSQELRFKDDNGEDFPEWEEKRLGEIVEVKAEKYNPGKEKESYRCIELEHLATGVGQLLGYVDSINSGSIKNKFKKGDVLFGKLRPYLKKYLRAPFNGVCSSEIWVLKGKEVLNEFLYMMIQTDYFAALANQSTGSKMPRADWSVLSDSIFSYPTIPEQTKIANFLSAIDEKINHCSKQIERMEEWKKGLLQQMFC